MAKTTPLFIRATFLPCGCVTRGQNTLFGELILKLIADGKIELLKKL